VVRCQKVSRGSVVLGPSSPWELIADTGNNDLDAGPGRDRAVELTGDWLVEHLGDT
jgi:hypothetical protein